MTTAGLDLDVSPEVALVVERALNQVLMTQAFAQVAQRNLEDIKALLNIPANVPIQVVGSKVRMFVQQPETEPINEAELLSMVGVNGNSH